MLKEKFKEFLRSRDFFTFDFQVCFETNHDPKYPTPRGGLCSFLITLFFGFMFIKKFNGLGKEDGTFTDTVIESDYKNSINQSFVL